MCTTDVQRTRDYPASSVLVTKHINGEDKMVWLDNAVWHWDPDTDAPASWNMDHADAQAYENLNNV